MNKAESKRICTLDLRRIALKRARDIDCKRFKASERWATDFKKAHRIVSRKITKFVTQRDLVQKPDVEEEALDFVLDVQGTIASKGPEKVTNSDQCGFECELRAGRTLTSKGLKKVVVVAQSKNALTHSYTIMPSVTASGKLIEPLYLVLREKDGKQSFTNSIPFPLVQMFIHSIFTVCVLYCRCIRTSGNPNHV